MSGMYGSSEVKNVDGGSAIFPVGITKMKLKDITFKSAKKDGSGDKVLAIEFEGDNGAIESLKLWPIDDKKESTFAGQGAKFNSTFKVGGKEHKFEEGKVPTKEALKAKEYFDFDVKVKHVISKFTEDTELTGVTSYDTLAKAVRDKLKPFIGTEIEGLFEYNNNFVRLYTKVPFLQKVGDITLQKSLAKAKLAKPDAPVADQEELPSTTTSSEAGW